MPSRSILRYVTAASLLAMASALLFCRRADDRGTVPVAGGSKVTPIEEVLAAPERFQNQRVRIVGRTENGGYRRHREGDHWIASSRAGRSCTALFCPPAPDGGQVCCNQCGDEVALFSLDPKRAESLPPITLWGEGMGCSNMDCEALKCNPGVGGTVEVVGIVDVLEPQGSDETLARITVETVTAR